ncbi:alpha/beta fold hydrolase [Kumtagia ephedrae]|uniref:Alpha/beta hydrolase n=1 Tax=Kumtagia ephedrae TaxID=2116701 RepID=A0A2P7RU43_9HYPH|nr:alpha/beta hydrolase [Mesorhizobium ephedrae]PSJ53747.1 alpha/beta hydrolase [Mesorhizobium ephedrae]
MAGDDGFTDFFYAAKDGLRLHARIYGEDRRGSLPAVCLPGLTRNARDFHELALFLSSHPQTPRKVVVFDYRGRGASAYDPEWKNYNVAREAEDVLAGLDALGIAEAAFIGTSRGGLIIHVIAAMRLTALKAVVLNDVGPAIEAGGLAHIVSYLQNAEPAASFADDERAQRAIHGADFPALGDADWSRLVRALYREEDGRPVADFDPALLRTLALFDLTKPLPTMWPQFDELRGIPLLTIRGERSKLLAAGAVEEMRRRHPGAEAITVAGQGHPPMLETAGLPERIADFFARADSEG